MEGRQMPPSRPPNPALPYREDCWSEGETSVLIDAWGDRYMELNRGNLRQKQWQEVADAVNSRPCDARRPPRTDVQCKNRIDTLKKKYKSMKFKISDGSGPSSHWIFYDRLDDLIGPSLPPLKKPTPPPFSVPLALPLPSHRKGISLPTASIVRPLPLPLQIDDSFYKRPDAAAIGQVPANHRGDSDSSSSMSSGLYRKKASRDRFGKGLKRKRSSRVESEEEVGIRELSKVIVRLGDIYERVEMEKQKQMVELEKQRIEFTKSLEVQKMQMFMDLQVELMKMERGAHRSEDPSSVVLPFLPQPVLL